MEIFYNEIKLIKRNKITHLYFGSAVLGAILFSVLFFLMGELRAVLKFHVSGLVLYSIGAPIYIYSVYSFSWEGNNSKLLLNSDRELGILIKNKLKFNQITSFLFFLVALLIINFRIDPLAFKMLLVSLFYNASIGNILALYLSSFQLRKIDLFENKFEIITQPPIHILLVLITAIIFMMCMFFLFFFGFKTEVLLGLILVFLSAYFIIKGLVWENIIIHLKGNAYGPN